MNARTVLAALLLAPVLAGCAGQAGSSAESSQPPRARCASAPSPGAPGGETRVFIYLLCVESP